MSLFIDFVSEMVFIPKRHCIYFLYTVNETLPVTVLDIPEIHLTVIFDLPEEKSPKTGAGWV